MEYEGYQNSLWILHMGKLITQEIMKSTVVVTNASHSIVYLCVCLHICLRHWKSEVNPERDSLLSHLASHFSFSLSPLWQFPEDPSSQKYFSVNLQSWTERVQRYYTNALNTNITCNTSQTGKAVIRTNGKDMNSHREREREKMLLISKEKKLCVCACDRERCMFLQALN